MDEREIREQLASAAEAIAPTPDLATRAEHRYLRRRNRVRVVGAAVVIALIASGVTTAAIVSRKTTNTIKPTVAPTTTNPSAVPRTTIANGAGAVDFNQLIDLSMVDATTGFGLLQDSDSQTGVIRSDDGGRSWRRIATLHDFYDSVHFESPSDGVAWGTGPLELTTDGGVHWKPVDGPVDNQLAWSQGRLWGMTPCVQISPCGSRPIAISDDAGRTWQRTTPLQQGQGPADLVVASRSDAYVVEPATQTQFVTAWQLALTHDGGASWTYRSVPCPSFTVSASLASNGTTLLLLCDGEPAGTTGMSQLLASADDGRTWVPRCQCLSTASLSSVGSTFLVELGRAGVESSTDDGRTWHWPEFEVGEQARLSASVPGVGIWLYIVRGSTNGIWFSADGVHWELRLQLTPTGKAVTPTTTTGPAGPPVDPKSISSLSFVDANTGFGLVHAPGVSMQSIVRTDDGGRTWHVVSTLQTANWFVHFESASDGVVWGDGTLHVTTDGGQHWRIPAGAPVDDVLAWSGGRIWALSCVNHSVCATHGPSVSDDGGSTWRTIAALDQSLKAGPIVATSRSDAYALDPSPQSSSFGMRLAATTDGGASWQHRPTPCALPYGSLASNGPTLLLYCRVTTAKSPESLYTSDDRGIMWTPQAAGPPAGSVSSLTNLGPVFVAGQHNGGLWSSSDGRSWHQAIRDAHFGWYLDALPGVGVWATNNDGSGARIWFSADGVHWEERAGG